PEVRTVYRLAWGQDRVRQKGAWLRLCRGCHGKAHDDNQGDVLFHAKPSESAHDVTTQLRTFIQLTTATLQTTDSSGDCPCCFRTVARAMPADHFLPRRR